VPALYTYGSEAYPTHLRASGFGWASSVSRIATGVAPFVYGAWLLPNIGLTGTFAATGALAVIGLVLMLVWGREDRGLVRTD
ncbi:MAG TPA: MFS transporter, partial [Brevibacterium ravenspurgense]|nr:MFS transporter [Brevibacterium ravenspurgense]